MGKLKKNLSQLEAVKIKEIRKVRLREIRKYDIKIKTLKVVIEELKKRVAAVAAKV